MFCKSENHVNSKREILSKGKYFFNCLKPVHIKKNCKAKLKCYRCQAEGSHHTALCFSRNGTPSAITGKNNHPNQAILRKRLLI